MGSTPPPGPRGCPLYASLWAEAGGGREYGVRGGEVIPCAEREAGRVPSLVWTSWEKVRADRFAKASPACLLNSNKISPGFPAPRLDVNPCLPLFQDLHEVSLGSTTSSACLQVL